RFQYRLKGEDRGVTLVELRCQNAQTVVPPSLHPEDHDRYEWHSFGEPARITAAELRRCAQKLAIGALLTRFWPGSRAKHHAALPIAGMLLSAGWPEEEAAELVFLVAQAAGHEKPGDRKRAVYATYTNHAAGRPTTGIPELKKYLPEEVVGTLVQWC